MVVGVSLGRQSSRMCPKSVILKGRRSGMGAKDDGFAELPNHGLEKHARGEETVMRLITAIQSSALLPFPLKTDSLSFSS